MGRHVASQARPRQRHETGTHLGPKHGPQRLAPAAQPIRTRRAWSIGPHRWSEAARSGRVGLNNNRAPCPFDWSHLFHVLELKRPRVSFSAATLVFVLMAFHAEPAWKPIGLVALRVYLPALMGLLVYSFFEHWPRDLPAPLARWVAGAGRDPGGAGHGAGALSWPRCARASRPSGWCRVRRGASLVHFFLGALVSAWVAMAALLRQRDAHLLQAERDARSELQQQALTRSCACCRRRWSRTSSNTLANVQAPTQARRAPRPCWPVLSPHLRAAVPRLQPDYRLGKSWRWCAPTWP